MFLKRMIYMNMLPPFHEFADAKFYEKSIPSSTLYLMAKCLSLSKLKWKIIKEIFSQSLYIF